ncbi:hypothetical protein K435DRAFT_799924 [Dendrothele bispora CBS 962.96]|uniref:Uncharacterized protein n=1 Tax=Dendrothele bispora (strain CBS 962.96) TaxID=1314807 RepID=A0A4S8LUT3_DENBC|nr:hypothetical protein K435DRAFT_799924 [Dendrothele bispora CBS 962.96]
MSFLVPHSRSEAVKKFEVLEVINQGSREFATSKMMNEIIPDVLRLRSRKNSPERRSSNKKSSNDLWHELKLNANHVAPEIRQGTQKSAGTGGTGTQAAVVKKSCHQSLAPLGCHDRVLSSHEGSNMHWSWVSKGVGVISAAYDSPDQELSGDTQTLVFKRGIELQESNKYLQRLLLIRKKYSAI